MLFSRLRLLALALLISGSGITAAFALDSIRYMPHAAGNQWSYISSNQATMINSFGSPVTLSTGVAAIPWTRVDSVTCVAGIACVTYNTFDANGYRKHQEYNSSVYVTGYGNTSATIVYTPALSVVPGIVIPGSTYTSTGVATITYTNVTTVGLNYRATTQAVGFETVSDSAGKQSWSALKVIVTVTLSGTVNGQPVSTTSQTTFWWGDGLGLVRAQTPNASGAMDTWKLVSTNVVMPTPTCTLTASRSPILAGGVSSLTASCGPAATSYVWAGGTCAGTGAANCTVSPSATTTYTVKSSNASGTGAAARATVTVAPAIPGEVVEFYNPDLDHYFITADAGEAMAIDNGGAGPGWGYTGNTFMSGGTNPVCRFYGSQSPGPNSHFYTADAGECGYLRQIQADTPATAKRWNFESLDFLSTPAANGTCPSEMVPVYRAYNNGFDRGVDSNHRITKSVAAIQEVITRGWKNEGVVMCSMH